LMAEIWYLVTSFI